MSVVRLQGVSKQFLVSHEKPALVRELLPRVIHPVHVEGHWAVRDITLELTQGTSLGIIGPNGSGKTTLLSLIAGITQPSTGTVRVSGRVATLLSLGSGFHPELTGLENIFLNGTLLGMTSREIRRKQQAIVEFSELNGFVDAPLQTYSAGMQLRLGFAIAIHTDADVLLIDEHLAVGDLAFQQKSLARLQALRKEGKTLVLVSQSPDLLERLCDRAVLLEHGRAVVDGPPHVVAGAYRHVSKMRAGGGPLAVTVLEGEPLYERLRVRLANERLAAESVRHARGTRKGSGQIQITHVEFLDADDRSRAVFETGECWKVHVRFTVREPVQGARFGVAIFRERDGAYVYGPNTLFDGVEFSELAPGDGDITLTINQLSLLDGTYYANPAWRPSEERVVEQGDYTPSMPYDNHIGSYAFQVRTTHAQATGLCQLPYEMTTAQHAAVPTGSTVLRTGDTFVARWRHGVRTPAGQQHHVQLIREDGLECFGLRTSADFRISPVQLLAGRYHLSVDQQRIQEIAVVSTIRDHGCVYLPHSWTVSRPCTQPTSER